MGKDWPAVKIVFLFLASNVDADTYVESSLIAWRGDKGNGYSMDMIGRIPADPRDRTGAKVIIVPIE
jgi:hypothetical protein